MRVAVLYATDFAGVSPGGIQNFVWRLGANAPSSSDITYFGVGAGDKLPRAQDHFMSVVRTLRHDRGVNKQFLHGLVQLRAAISDYDVVVAHRPEYLAAMAVSKVPAVLVLHGASLNAWRTGRRGFGMAYLAAEMFACARSSAVISVDPDGANRISRMLAGNLNRTVVPADAAFHIIPDVPEPRPWRIITACRLVPEKRVHRVIALAAAARLPALILGEGPCEAALKEYARELGGDVTFSGHVGVTDMAHEYRRGGVFVMASQFEGYPLAAVEAACAGLPLMGVESDCLRPLHGHGARSYGSIAEAVRALQGPQRSVDTDSLWAHHRPDVVSGQFWDRVGTAVR